MTHEGAPLAPAAPGSADPAAAAAPAPAATSDAGSAPAGGATAAVKRATDRAVAARLAAEPAFADMVEMIQPSVVTVTAQLQDPFTGGTVATTGSGVIVTRNGYVLTNAHVLDGAGSVIVTLMDGRELRAQVVDQRAERDLALLKVNATKLRAAQVGNSGKVRVGQTAIAIGNPLGRYPGTVTRGIVSGLDRSIDTDLGWETLRLTGLIQTDAAINEGSSGGALFDLDGRLIGITNAVNRRAQGVGFAIPISAASALLDQARQNAG